MRVFYRLRGNGAFGLRRASRVRGGNTHSVNQPIGPNTSASPMPSQILPRHQPSTAPTTTHNTVNQMSGHHGTSARILAKMWANASGESGSIP